MTSDSDQRSAVVEQLQVGRASASSPRAAVIGGGLAGLVAAWELARNGVDVVLFERDARLGGRVCGGELGGVHFDLGPESYATRGGEVEGLLADLGLQERITTTSGRRSWIVGGRVAAPLPPAGAIGIPAQPWSAETRRIIGLLGAARCAIEPFLPRRIGQNATSLGALVRARLGRRTLERLVAPVVRGIYSADPYALPVTAVPGLAKTRAEHGSLRAAARKQRGSVLSSGAAVAGVRGGVHTLVTHLALELERLGAQIRCETEVTALRRLDAGYEVVGGNPEQGWTVDAVLVTVPGILRSAEGDPRPEPGGSSREAHSSDELVKSDEVSPAVRPDDAMTRVEVVAILVEDDRLNAAPRGSGALVAEEARRATPPVTAKALTHANMKWDWLDERLSANCHLLRLSYGEHGSDAVTLQMPDSDVERLALADASAILGVDLPRESLKGAARQKHSVPQHGADSQHRLTPQTVRQASAQPSLPGVFTAGEWVAGTGFAAVVPSARASARAMLEALAAQAQPDQH